MKKKIITWLGVLSAIATIIGVALQSVDFFKVQNTETVKTESEFKNKLQSNDIKVESNGIINQGVIGNINNNSNQNYNNISNIQSQQIVSNVNNNYNNNRNLNYTNIQNKITDSNENKRELYRKKENIIKELEMFRENYFEWDNRKVENTYEKLKQDINLNFKRKQELNNLEKEMFDINYNYGNFLNLTKKEQIDKINKNTWNSLTEAMKLEAEETLKK